MPPARIALWVASLGGLALLARTLLGEPPPLWLAATAFVLYFAFATLGVLVPRLEMYGEVVWRTDSAVALTFDDGPHPVTTRRVLEILAKYGHKATFFVIGQKVQLYPDVVREIHAAGHAIGLHGYAHDRLFSLKPPSYVRRDIERTQRAVEAACGVRPTLFRPPIGYMSPRTAQGASKAGAIIVTWSVRAYDGLGRANADKIVQRIARGLEPGAIVLLHDAAEREDFTPASLEALPRILELIRERGLATRTLDELVES